MQQSLLSPTTSPSLLLHGGRPATTSLEVAKFFGKRHDHVLRDIDNLLSQLPENSLQPNFGETFQEQETPFGVKQIRLFILYRDGFMLLVMGYTGKKALQIKLAYIKAFNQMEAQLAANKVESSTSLPQSAELLPPSHQAQLKAIVDAKVGMLPSEAQRKAYAEIWSRFSRHFQIARYQQLPSERVGEAITYLVEMQLKKRRELPMPTPIPQLPSRIDEAPFLDFIKEVEAAHKEVDHIISSLQDRICDLCYSVGNGLEQQADIRISFVKGMDVTNSLTGYLCHTMLSGVKKAMVFPDEHLDSYANPGYSLLGIVKQLNSARK